MKRSRDMQPVIEVRNLSKQYGDFALRDVSFELPEGYVMGLIGPNGAGKTTIIKLLMNLIRSDDGSIRLFGKQHENDSVAIKSRIGFVYDNPNYYDRLNLKQFRNLIAPFYSGWDEGMFQDLVGRFGLPLRKRMSKFSRGMTMKAAIAVALSHGADLIIMDEPTTGLDVLVQEQILRRVREIRAEVSSSIILITHDIAVIAEMSDRISIMYGGKIVESATAIDLFESPFHPYTLGLKNAFPSISVMDNELISIPGTPPALIGEESGCLFEPRCPFSDATCAQILPQSHSVGEMHQVSCHRHTDVTELREKASKKSTWHC